MVPLCIVEYSGTCCVLARPCHAPSVDDGADSGAAVPAVAAARRIPQQAKPTVFWKWMAEDTIYFRAKEEVGLPRKRKRDKKLSLF